MIELVLAFVFLKIRFIQAVLPNCIELPLLRICFELSVLGFDLLAGLQLGA